MTQVLTNHFDAVISVLLSDPFNDWEQWRAVETGRDSLCVNPVTCTTVWMSSEEV